MFFPFLALVSFSHLFPKASPNEKIGPVRSEAMANPKVDPQSCSEWPNLEGTVSCNVSYPSFFFMFLSIKYKYGDSDR